MKLACLITAIASMGIAGTAFWNARAVQQSSQDELATLTLRVETLNQQLAATAEFQGLMRDIGSINQETKSNNVDTKDNRNRNVVLDDRLRNQGRANDNQWQDIDYLKKQRQFHKQLIDQINTDLVKIKRENRKTSATLQEFGKGSGSVTMSDFAVLKHKVDELYRIINSGGR